MYKVFLSSLTPEQKELDAENNKKQLELLLVYVASTSEEDETANTLTQKGEAV